MMTETWAITENAPSAAWREAFAAMHRDGAAEFSPAGLHYVLERVRREAADGTALPPADLVSALRASVRADFGPLAREVLEDWGLRLPADLGRAVSLLGRYGCLTLDPGDTPEAYAADTAHLAEVHP